MSPGLLIFTRYPQPGESKTRLIPALGAVGAAQLQTRMTEHTINQARILQTLDHDIHLSICYAGGDLSLIQAWLGEDFSYRSQIGPDLGARIIQALTQHFAHQEQPALVIGTDCPDLTAPLLQEAFRLLVNHDLVLGPAWDGGYYLIGLKKLFTELFTGISWGSDQVLRETIEIAQALNLTVAQLLMLRDIDRPEDLTALTESGYGNWLP